MGHDKARLAVNMTISGCKRIDLKFSIGVVSLSNLQYQWTWSLELMFFDVTAVYYY